MEMTAEEQDQQEQAAAIAEVAAIPEIEPTNTNLNPSIRAANTGGGGGGGGGTRVNEAADEAMQGGDLQNVDGPGAEVQAMFIEFLFGL
jgi:hypothetical protein